MLDIRALGDDRGFRCPFSNLVNAGSAKGSEKPRLLSVVSGSLSRVLSPRPAC